jgi:hypothetical protein
MTGSRSELPPPKGLQPAQAETWRDLVAAYPRWSRAELYAFEMFLRLQGQADECEARGDLALALKARTVGFRFWRTLKFTDPAQPAAKVGRPSGSNWNAARKAGAAAVIATIGAQHAE